MALEFKCSHCEKSYPKNKSLKVHIINKHLPENEGVWHKCEETLNDGSICDCKNRSAYELKKHKELPSKKGMILKKSEENDKRNSI